MKATDFDLSRELVFDPASGLTRFRENRVVLFDAGAIGLLRQGLLEELGADSARKFLLRFGYQNGVADFYQMKFGHEFDTEMDLLASGPVIHTWEGIVHAAPTEIRFDRQAGTFYFTGVWTNSYEAEQHVAFNGPADGPVCWTLTGYASGWCTAFFGSTLIAVEPHCTAKGDPRCGWLIRPPADCGPEAAATIDALACFSGE
jgi:hypothetical protein